MSGNLNKKSYKCDISRLRNLVPYFGDLYLHEIESYHIVEYRKQRLQEKAANRKNLVNPGTVNREEEKRGQSKNPFYSRKDIGDCSKAIGEYFFVIGDFSMRQRRMLVDYLPGTGDQIIGPL